MRIALVANSAWYLYNFRRNLSRVLKAAGHEVATIAPDDGYGSRLISEGVRFRPIPLDSAGTNPIREIRTILALSRILREERTELVLSWTPKGNIYAGLAAGRRRLHRIANVSGLGRAFIKKSALTLLVRFLYRLTLGQASWIFFQNEDDKKTFIASGLVNAARAERIPGSGIDLTHFQPQAPSPGGDHCCDTIFLMVARLLWDKGVGEFVEAARRLHAHHPRTAFQLLGPIGVANPSAVPRPQVEAWIREGIIEYLGETDDVRPYIAAASCVVLPSYREGVPRSLLEAAAMGKPIIATDAPGCRDAVEDGLTGFLCRAKDAGDLADKMAAFLALSPADRAEMGRRAREKMEREFDEKIVIARYCAALERLTVRDRSGMVSDVHHGS